MKLFELPSQVHVLSDSRVRLYSVCTVSSMASLYIVEVVLTYLHVLIILHGCLHVVYAGTLYVELSDWGKAA